MSSAYEEGIKMIMIFSFKLRHLSIFVEKEITFFGSCLCETAK